MEEKNGDSFHSFLPIFLVGVDLDLLNEKKLNHARPKRSQSTSPGERDARAH